MLGHALAIAGDVPTITVLGDGPTILGSGLTVLGGGPVVLGSGPVILGCGLAILGDMSSTLGDAAIGAAGGVRGRQVMVRCGGQFGGPS